MMKTHFIHDNFLLENKFAEELYHRFAKDLPIIDYHNHLSPKFIANNHQFSNITELWINGDHYKWRAMRTLGINEKYITGNASSQEKFMQWAKTVPYTMRNPLYHWTHLELARYFGIHDLLSEKTAEAIYEETLHQINTSKFSCQNILKNVNAELVCTTDDPMDDLSFHQQIKNTDFEVDVLPTFRPDKAILIIDQGFNQYINQLETSSNTQISTFEDLCNVLAQRIQYFDAIGCKISDHGLQQILFVDYTLSEVSLIFQKKRNNQPISDLDNAKYQTALLLFLSQIYHKYGWVQQFHLGALRNNNKRMHQLLGPDTGWDSMGDFSQAASLSAFLNQLDSNNQLTKTILYNLNPADNEMMATMIGNFNDGSIKGKIQFGSGWWFLDQKDGMIKQLNALSNMGLLSCFVGMLTDSRSFLSFPRHEYFRRILCNLLGKEIQRGELPNDIDWIGKLVSDICYYNAKNYFNFKTKVNNHVFRKQTLQLEKN